MSLLLIRLFIVVMAILITVQGVAAYLRKREMGYLFIAASVGFIPVLFGVLFYLVFRGSLRVPRTAESAALEHIIRMSIIGFEYLSIFVGIYLLSKQRGETKTSDSETQSQVAERDKM